MDECVGPGQQLAIGVVDIHLDQQRARRRVDGALVRTSFPWKSCPGYSSSVTVGVAPTASREIDLRHRDIDRNVSVAAMWNSSALGMPAPALIRWPISVLRAVITPSNGA